MRRRSLLATLPVGVIGCLGIIDSEMEIVYSDSVAMLEVEPASVILEEGETAEIAVTIDDPGYIELEFGRRDDVLFEERVDSDVEITAEADQSGSYTLRVNHRTADGEVTVRTER